MFFASTNLVAQAGDLLVWENDITADDLAQVQHRLYLVNPATGEATLLREFEQPHLLGGIVGRVDAFDERRGRFYYSTVETVPGASRSAPGVVFIDTCTLEMTRHPLPEDHWPVVALERDPVRDRLLAFESDRHVVAIEPSGAAVRLERADFMSANDLSAIDPTGRRLFSLGAHRDAPGDLVLQVRDTVSGVLLDELPVRAGLVRALEHDAVSGQIFLVRQEDRMQLTALDPSSGSEDVVGEWTGGSSGSGLSALDPAARLLHVRTQPVVDDELRSLGHEIVTLSLDTGEVVHRSLTPVQVHAMTLAPRCPCGQAPNARRTTQALRRAGGASASLQASPCEPSRALQPSDRRQERRRAR